MSATFFFSLTTSLGVFANSYPACINSTITLPGSGGPEIWSCVASNAGGSSVQRQHSNQYLPKDRLALANNQESSISVDKRANTSSPATQTEISRVLEQTPARSSFKKPKFFAIGMQYSTNRRNKGLRDTRGRSQIMPFSLGMDLTDNTRISVNIPVIHKESELVATSGVHQTNAFGVGDIGLNTNTDVLQENGKRPRVSLNFGIGAPTGKVEDPYSSGRLSLGSGFWSASAGATISKRFDPATVFASFRYQHAFGDRQFGYDVQPGDTFEYGYGLGVSLNNSLSVSGRIAGAIHRNARIDGETIEGSNSEPVEFISASSLRLSENTRLESSLSFGLNNDASDATLGLTLNKNF